MRAEVYLILDWNESEYTLVHSITASSLYSKQKGSSSPVEVAKSPGLMKLLLSILCHHQRGSYKEWSRTPHLAKSNH